MADKHDFVANTLQRMSTHAASQASKPSQARRRDKLIKLSQSLAHAKSELDKLKQPGVTAAVKDKEDVDKSLSELVKGLPDIENGIVDSIRAFEGGDPLAEAESIMNLCSSLVNTLGSMAGPEGEIIGGLLGALFGTISDIMGLFEPKKPTLLDQISTLLRQQQARAELEALQLALDNFEGLEDVWKAGFWREVNLQDGDEIKRVRKAAIWLESPENQREDTRDLWFQLLEMQCKVFIETVRAVPLALGALQKHGMSAADKRNAAGLLKVGLRTTQRKQLEFLKKIVPFVQDHGIFWYISNDGYFACTDYCTDYHDKPNPDFRGLGVGQYERMSVTIAAADKGRAHPNLHLFALGNGNLMHGRMKWPSGGLDEFRPLPTEDLQGCTDVWATWAAANPDDTEQIYFYSAHRATELRGTCSA